MRNYHKTGSFPGKPAYRVPFFWKFKLFFAKKGKEKWTNLKKSGISWVKASSKIFRKI